MNEFCSNHQPQFVRSITEGGRTQLRKQCLNCGEVEDRIFKFSECADMEKIPILDIALREQLYMRRSEQRQLEYAIERENRKQQYANYLKSYEWKRKHDFIMNKYGFICILCFRPAVNVHHLTYDRIYLEDERDLIPLCKSCHEFVHGINKESTIL